SGRGVSAVPPRNATGYPGERAAIRENQNRAARASATAAVILGLKSGHTVGGNCARPRDRAGVNNYDSAARGSAAEDAGAVCAAVGVASIGIGNPVGAVVCGPGAASTTHDERAGTGGKNHAAENSDDSGALPAKNACAAVSAVSAGAAAAVLIIGSGIGVGGAARCVAWSTASVTAVRHPFKNRLCGAYGGGCRSDGADSRSNIVRRSGCALPFGAVGSLRG